MRRSKTSNKELDVYITTELPYHLAEKVIIQRRRLGANRIMTIIEERTRRVYECDTNGIPSVTQIREFEMWRRWRAYCTEHHATSLLMGAFDTFWHRGLYGFVRRRDILEMTQGGIHSYYTSVQGRSVEPSLILALEEFLSGSMVILPKQMLACFICLEESGQDLYIRPYLFYKQAVHGLDYLEAPSMLKVLKCASKKGNQTDVLSVFMRSQQGPLVFSWRYRPGKEIVRLVELYTQIRKNLHGDEMARFVEQKIHGKVDDKKIVTLWPKGCTLVNIDLSELAKCKCKDHDLQGGCQKGCVNKKVRSISTSHIMSKDRGGGPRESNGTWFCADYAGEPLRTFVKVYRDRIAKEKKNITQKRIARNRLAQKISKLEISLQNRGVFQTYNRLLQTLEMLNQKQNALRNDNKTLEKKNIILEKKKTILEQTKEKIDQRKQSIMKMHRLSQTERARRLKDVDENIKKNMKNIQTNKTKIQYNEKNIKDNKTKLQESDRKLKPLSKNDKLLEKIDTDLRTIQTAPDTKVVLVDLFLQALERIQVFHSKGIQHGDLHEDNMCISGERFPCQLNLIDFDLAKTWDITDVWDTHHEFLVEMEKQLIANHETRELTLAIRTAKNERNAAMQMFYIWILIWEKVKIDNNHWKLIYKKFLRSFIYPKVDLLKLVWTFCRQLNVEIPGVLKSNAYFRHLYINSMHTTKNDKGVWEKDDIQREFVNYIKQALQESIGIKPSNSSTNQTYQIQVESTDGNQTNEILTMENVLSFYSSHQGYGRLPFKVNSQIQESLLLAGLPSVQCVIDSIRNPVLKPPTELLYSNQIPPFHSYNNASFNQPNMQHTLSSAYEGHSQLLPPNNDALLNQQNMLYPPFNDDYSIPSINPPFPADMPSLSLANNGNTQTNIPLTSANDLDLDDFNFNN